MLLPCSDASLSFVPLHLFWIYHFQRYHRVLFPREAATSGDLHRRMISVDDAVVYSWRSSIADFLYFSLFWCVAVAPLVRALDKEMAESETQHTPGAAALSEAGAIRPACPLSSQRSTGVYQYF